MVINREVYDMWCIDGYTTKYECLECGADWFDDTEGLDAPPLGEDNEETI
jgi:hypothetical protein